MIIEPDVIPKVVSGLDQIYLVVRSAITGALNGKTFLLFEAGNVDRILEVCIGENCKERPDYPKLKTETLAEICHIITSALVTQLCTLTNLDISSNEPEILFASEEKSVKHIIGDFQSGQPFVITIKTHFKGLMKSVELPMLVVFDTRSLFTLLEIIRKNNLYDYLLLKAR